MRENYRWLISKSPVGALAALYRGEDINSLTWEWSGNEKCQNCGAETIRVEGRTTWSAPSCVCEPEGLAELIRYIELLNEEKIEELAKRHPDTMLEVRERLLDVEDWLREEEFPELKDIERFNNLILGAIVLTLLAIGAWN
jgi:hypothetical protein